MPDGDASRTCQADGSWSRSAPTQCADPPRILVVGGYTGSGSSQLATAELYDSGTGAWSNVASMGTGRMRHAIAAFAGIVYVAGGSDGNSYFSSAEAYDISADSWSTIASLQTPRGSAAGAAVDSKVFVFGGRESPSANMLSSGETYDPAANSWSSIADMMTARQSHTAVAIGSSIYVMGGQGSSGDGLSSGEVYAVGTNSWSSIADMDSTRYSHAAAALGTNIYVVAGSGANSDTVAVYGTAVDSWSSVAPMRTSRGSRPGATAIASSLVVMGGQGWESGLDVTYDSAEAYNSAADTWSDIASISTARYYTAAVAILPPPAPPPPLPDPNADAFLQAQPEIGAHTWVACFDSAVDDASTPAAFHANCDAFAETVTVARNELGYTFGGYAERSWSLDTCLVNGGDQPGNYCNERTASGNFIFGLEPGSPERFDPTGVDTNYQRTGPSYWPVWGLHGALSSGYNGYDLSMGTGNGPPGTNQADCFVGQTYGASQPDQICGRTAVNCCPAEWSTTSTHAVDGWGTTEIEVWRRARTCATPCADGGQCVDGSCICAATAGQDMATVGQWAAADTGGALSVCLADDAAAPVGTSSSEDSSTVAISSGELELGCAKSDGTLCAMLDRLDVNGDGVHLTLSRLSFRNMMSSSGAAVDFTDTQLGVLTVTDCEFIGNSAAVEGGAIRVDRGVLFVTDCEFIDNSAQVNAGGAICVPQSTATITGSLFSGNIAANRGGAIYTYRNTQVNNVGTVAVKDCTFTGNTATLSGGGAIRVDGAGNLRVTGSSFVDNTANTGGSIALEGDSMFSLSSSTFAGGSAGDSSGIRWEPSLAYSDAEAEAAQPIGGLHEHCTADGVCVCDEGWGGAVCVLECPAGTTSCWDSGAVTNANGKSFSLYLLPPQPSNTFVEYEGEGVQVYVDLCEAAGLRTLTSGAGTWGPISTHCPGYNCMPLVSDDSSIPSVWVVAATGWDQYTSLIGDPNQWGQYPRPQYPEALVTHDDHNSQLYNWRAAGPSSAGWDAPISPVCGAEHCAPECGAHQHCSADGVCV